jgi:hypothetical protein
MCVGRTLPVLAISCGTTTSRVDASIIWKAVKDDLPSLKEALLALGESLK